MRTQIAIAGALAITIAGLTGCTDDQTATQPLASTESIDLTDTARRPDDSGNTILDIAIGLSEARKKGAKVPRKRKKSA